MSVKAVWRSGGGTDGVSAAGVTWSAQAVQPVARGRTRRPWNCQVQSLLQAPKAIITLNRKRPGINSPVVVYRNTRWSISAFTEMWISLR